MRRGAWHQFGDRSQRLVEEQLGSGAGVGTIISPRDLSRPAALEYAEKYRRLGASVVIDHQFYVPDFRNPHLNSYPISQLRTTISSMNRISDQDLTELGNQLRIDHEEFRADAVIAPAVVYEVGRPEIAQLTARLFSVSKQVGDDLNIPTYATVVLGRSVAASDLTVSPVLSQATALNSDGWYFAFEFENQRVPSIRESVRRCCTAGLTLACTGKPVLHAFAGPLGLVSFAFGASGVGIGHSQNLWKFCRERWQTPGARSGGGEAPPRFFSSALWGTIVYPDETSRLPSSLRFQVLTSSHFSRPVDSNLEWTRWDAGKHLVYMLAMTFAEMAAEGNASANARAAITRLEEAGRLHRAIQQSGLFLGDDTNSYQDNWRLAVEDVLRDRVRDFEYLELLI